MIGTNAVLLPIRVKDHSLANIFDNSLTGTIPVIYFSNNLCVCVCACVLAIPVYQECQEFNIPIRGAYKY